VQPPYLLPCVEKFLSGAKPGTRILNLGCGNGSFLARFNGVAGPLTARIFPSRERHRAAEFFRDRKSAFVAGGDYSVFF